MMPQLRDVIFLLTIFIFQFCTQPGDLVTDFPNVLNVRNTPQQSEDWSTFCFSDLGAWHGFALPDVADSSFYGGFAGPFLMTHGRWLSKCLVQLNLYDVGNDRKIDLSKSLDAEINHYPGRLIQKLNVDSLFVQIELGFITDRSALIRASFFNDSDQYLRLRVSWQGSVFLEQAEINSNQSGIQITFDNEKISSALILSPEMAIETVISQNKKAYLIKQTEILELSPNQNSNHYIAHSLLLNSEELTSETKRITAIFKNPDHEFSENRKRWNCYLRKALKTNSQFGQNKSDQTIAVKALMTLINNWRSSNGHLHHDGLFPSYAVGYFNGFWAWDSWKHATALARFAPELAKNQIRTMFDYQDQYGMIADVIYADSSENNWRDTKPPLAGWSIWNVYESIDDRPFLEEMYPKIIRYHKWWYQNRDHDQNGLCEYGATDGTLIAAKWESGMDNAVRFDDSKMVQNNEQSWSMNQESVDLNSYLFAEKLYLAKMAGVLGHDITANQFKVEAEQLRTHIQKTMFDEETGYFYDISLEDKTFIKVQSPEGWIPLWAGVATVEQASRVKELVIDSTKFATYIPFPTVARDNPKFSRGYWRGPVWLDQAYFAIAGLRRYGYQEEAKVFTRQLFDRLGGLKNSEDPIRENYDPITGEGLNVNHFSWSAAHLLMLYWEAK